MTAVALSGVQELDMIEIDQANGGIPLLVAAVWALYGTEIAFGAGVVAGAATAIVAYANG